MGREVRRFIASHGRRERLGGGGAKGAGRQCLSSETERFEGGGARPAQGEAVLLHEVAGSSRPPLITEG